MTTYPLPTLGCTVTPTGISAPSYADIVASLQASFQSIYGSDSYIDPDSEDGQMLGIFARAQTDSNNATIAAYNNFSPATAVGTGLSSVVKINGLKRKASSFSTVDVVVVGQAGKVIQAGIVGDNQNLGTRWTLPGDILIPPGGSITVTATCTTPGAVAAAANAITVILTPVVGWQSVNNPSNASLGLPVEDDAQLRLRQSTSTALSAMTTLETMQGNLANLPGVGRLVIHENDTNSTDGDGVLAKSICVVIEGGDATAIATIIEQKKSLGCGTFGSTSVNVLDPGGQTITIKFDVLTYTQLFLEVVITPGNGYTDTIGSIVLAAVIQYINALTIGADVQLTKLYGPANLSGTAAIVAASIILGSQQTQAQLDVLSNTYELNSVKIGAPPLGALSESIVTPGTGYAAGNVLTVVGGTSTVTAQITVDTVSGGAITAAHISRAGTYTVPPTNPAAVTGGAGSGATFNLEFLSTADVTIAFNAVAQTQTAQATLALN